MVLGENSCRQRPQPRREARSSSVTTVRRSAETSRRSVSSARSISRATATVLAPASLLPVSVPPTAHATRCPLGVYAARLRPPRSTSAPIVPPRAVSYPEENPNRPSHLAPGPAVLAVATIALSTRVDAGMLGKQTAKSAEEALNAVRSAHAR